MGEYELFDEIKGMKIRQNDISLQIPKLENKISEIDAQIADCEEKLRNAEQEEARLFNKIFNQDEKYEQVADNYRKQIEDLNGMKKRYQSEIESLNAEATNINTKLPVADQLINENGYIMVKNLRLKFSMFLIERQYYKMMQPAIQDFITLSMNLQ